MKGLEFMISFNRLLKSNVTFILYAGIISVLVSCASTRPPMQELAQTEAVINQADQVGAEEYAPLEIREARKKLQQARELESEEKYEEAKRMAFRAEVDAELAEAKALSEKAQNAVQQLRESIKLLREEIKQKQQRQ
jgi:predicted S18 family serine protease